MRHFAGVDEFATAHENRRCGGDLRSASRSQINLCEAGGATRLRPLRLPCRILVTLSRSMLIASLTVTNNEHTRCHGILVRHGNGMRSSILNDRAEWAVMCPAEKAWQTGGRHSRLT